MHALRSRSIGHGVYLLSTIPLQSADRCLSCRSTPPSRTQHTTASSSSRRVVSGRFPIAQQSVAQFLVRPFQMLMLEVLCHLMVQVFQANRDEVVQALAPQRLDPPLDVGRCTAAPAPAAVLIWNRVLSAHGTACSSGARTEGWKPSSQVM